MTDKPKALVLVDALKDGFRDANPEDAAAELRRLHEYEIGYEEWSDKTNWMLSTYQISELGMHRADILKKRIDRLHEVNQALIEALEEVCRVIKSNPSSICDTVWVTGNSPETLYDYCLDALAKAKEST